LTREANTNDKFKETDVRCIIGGKRFKERKFQDAKTEEAADPHATHSFKGGNISRKKAPKTRARKGIFTKPSIHIQGDKGSRHSFLEAVRRLHSIHTVGNESAKGALTQKGLTVNVDTVLKY